MTGMQRMSGRRAMAVAMALAAASGAAPVAANPQAGLQLDWLAGHWCGDSEGARVEEVWLHEAAGTLLGMSRTMRGSRTESFEFMRIAADAGKPAFHVQPDGAPPTVFATKERGDGWIRFANAAHDFPNVIEYRRIGDRLSAWIAGPGPDGKALRIPFEYRACEAEAR